MKLLVRNELLATHEVRGVLFTDDAIEQLRQQLPGANVYSGYSGPIISPIEKYSKSIHERIKVQATAMKRQIGCVEGVVGDQIIITIDDDEVPVGIDENSLIAKLNILVEPHSIPVEGEQVVEKRIIEVLGVYLVERGDVDGSDED